MAFGQNIDSIKTSIQNLKHDTSKCRILSDLIDAEMDINIWPLYNEELKVECESFLDTCSANNPLRRIYLGNLATTLSNLGFLAEMNGEISSAVGYFQQSIAIQEEIDDKKGIATTLTNLGYIYQSQGDIPNALMSYHKGLKIQEEIKDIKGIGASLVSIGYIHHNQNDYESALEFYKRSLDARRNVDDKSGIANSLNNIGVIYQNQGDNDVALDYFQQSLAIRKEINQQRGVASSLNNIGDIYRRKGDYNKALDYFNESLQIREKINHKNGVSASLNNIAIVMLKTNKLKEGINYAERSLQLAKKLGYTFNIKQASETLSALYAKVDNWDKAYEMHVLFKQMSDSITNESTQKVSMQKQFQYEYEKKVAADSIANLKANEIKNAQIAQQKAELKAKQNQQYALFGGVGLILLFSFFIYNRYKITQKQKVIIEETNEELNQTNEELAAQRDAIDFQKNRIEIAHQEIKASISYAKRIQEAILPSISSVNKGLPHSFVLYKPKDVVAGDFYWMEIYENKVYIAAADCTGHGVPGAMVSVVCSNALTKSLLEEGITDVGKILDRTREIVVERLSKSGDDVKDGMDISIACFDFVNMKLEWSGANNPLYFLRHSNSSNEVRDDQFSIEITKGDREPIGQTENPTPFAKHTFELNKGDTLYLFTDGYADQFGGLDGKKLGYKKFREKLIEISNENMDKQKELLSSYFKKWKGIEEQVDDVCIIGVKI